MSKAKVNEWFTIKGIDTNTYVISEYHHPEETHCYLLNGREYSLLIDTGLGIDNIYEQVKRLTDKPIIVVATHVHWDHIGGHQYFPEFYVHEHEVEWITGGFPLPLQVVRNSVLEATALPENFDIKQYEIFNGQPTRVLKDNDTIDLGGRTIQVLHTPGHSPGHMCFFEEATGYLFTGDLIYKGTLFAFYPSTDPVAYLASVEKIAKLSVKKVLPGHHDLNISVEIIDAVSTALTKLSADNKLQHRSGIFEYQDFSIHL